MTEAAPASLSHADPMAGGACGGSPRPPVCRVRIMPEAAPASLSHADPMSAAAVRRDLFAKFDAVIAERDALLEPGVNAFGLVMEKVLSPTRAICNGKETILLGTYTYMGMTFDADD